MTDNTIQLDSGGSVLFVGNSFTFGRVDPVMSYNSANVRDLTAPTQGGTFANTSGSNVYEPHPWGGVPGIFQAFAQQVGLQLDVAISARNAATLQGQYLNSNPAGWDLRGNVASQAWDTVVLQDNSTQALPSGAGTITFAAGSSTATLTIDPTPDTKVETDETIGIQVTANAAYRTSSGVVTGTILNDDPTGPVVNPALPTVTLVASPGAVLEDGPQKLVYTFTRTGPTTSALTVNFGATRDGSTAPSVNTSTGDFENFVNLFTTSFQANGQQTTGSMSFTSNSGSVVIPAGASSVTFTLDPKPDTTVEADESVHLTLSANAAYNVGTQGAVTATILNDDFAAGTDTSLPNISLSLASSGVFEDGSGNLVYQFTRTGSNTAPLTVNFGVSGTATLPGNDFTVTGANTFSTPGAADPNLQSFNTYAVKLAQYATTGAADGAVPANPNADPATDVYLYETWARPNMVTGALVANTDDTTGAVTTTTTTAPEYYVSLEAMTADLRSAYEGLAAANPIFAGVAPVGAAFLAAVQDGTAMRDPYAPDAGADGKIDLWWDDNLHASKYGSYLSGLTLFGTLTGLDPRSLGAAEHVAADLGITQEVAAALQAVAAATLGFSLDAHWTAPGHVTGLTGGATGLLATAGSFGFSDSDKADTHTVTVTPVTPGAIGTFTAGLHTDTTGDGTGGSINWLFTADNADLASFAPGESRVEHFLVSIADATGGLAQRDIAVTIDQAPACYCPGTLIETVEGERLVESLAIGDLIVTASGAARAIKWIGRRSYGGRFLLGNKHVLPICIKAGALDDNVPRRDLWISPHHAMYLEDVLIEARYLVNGRSVVQAEQIDEVQYFHIELDTHDVLVAEGAASESFLDDDSRGMFHNAHEYRDLYPDAPKLPVCYFAPRPEDGYEIEAVRASIERRCGLRTSTEEPVQALRGFIDVVGPTHIAGWAQNPDYPEAPVCLDIYAGDLLIGQTLANSYRADLERAWLGSGNHSFKFKLPVGSRYDNALIAVRRSLDGAPLASHCARVAARVVSAA